MKNSSSPLRIVIIDTVAFFAIALALYTIASFLAV